MNYILIIPKLTEMKQEIVIRDKEGIVVFVALKTQKHFHFHMCKYVLNTHFCVERFETYVCMYVGITFCNILQFTKCPIK